MNPKMMTRTELVAVLRNMANHVEMDDSFDGSIEYHLEIQPDNTEEYGVVASYRIGNREGQGGVRMIGEMEPSPAPETEAKQCGEGHRCERCFDPSPPSARDERPAAPTPADERCPHGERYPCCQCDANQRNNIAAVGRCGVCEHAWHPRERCWAGVGGMRCACGSSTRAVPATPAPPDAPTHCHRCGGTGQSQENVGPCWDCAPTDGAPDCGRCGHLFMDHPVEQDGTRDPCRVPGCACAFYDHRAPAPPDGGGARPSNVGCDWCAGSESDHERGCPKAPTPGGGDGR